MELTCKSSFTQYLATSVYDINDVNLNQVIEDLICHSFGNYNYNLFSRSVLS